MCSASGLAQTRHALLNKGQVYFGIAELVGQAQHFVPVVAWRSSHNQRVAASLYVGAGVRELNNVCLTTEVRVASRQTLNFAERLPDLVHDALSEVSTIAHQQRSTFQRLIDTKLSDEDAERAIIEMIRMDIVSPSKSGLVIEQWDSPENEALAAKRNVWRLYNTRSPAATSRSAPTDAVNALIERSPRLMSFCKAMVLERL